MKVSELVSRLRTADPDSEVLLWRAWEGPLGWTYADITYDAHGLVGTAGDPPAFVIE